jgi:hypothetical protein
MSRISSSTNGNTTAISELLDAIVKKAGFKQLAGYSIQCLGQLLSPTRLGWENLSREANNLGGAISVLNVLNRYSNDTELLGFGITALKSMWTAPGSTAPSTEAISLSVGLMVNVWNSDSNESEKISAIISILDLSLVLVTRSPDQLVENGFLSFLDNIAAKLAQGWAAQNATTNGLSVAFFRIFASLTAESSIILSLCSHGMIIWNILASAMVLFGYADSEISKALTDAITASTEVPSKRANISSFGSSGNMKADPMAIAAKTHIALRGFIEPILRALDRLTRVAEGLQELIRIDALGLTLPLFDYWLHAADLGAAAPVPVAASALQRGRSFRGNYSSSNSTNATSVTVTSVGSSFSTAQLLELFSRLVDDQISRLIHTAGGTDANSGQTDTEERRQQAARMLARLSEIPMRADELLHDEDLLALIIAAINGAISWIVHSSLNDAISCPLVISTALFSTLTRVAERGPTGISPAGIRALLDAGILPVVLAGFCSSLLCTSTIPADACAAATSRLLYDILSVAGSWSIHYSNGRIVSNEEAIDDGTILTVLSYALAWNANTLINNEFPVAGGLASKFTSGFEYAFASRLASVASASLQLDSSPLLLTLVVTGLTSAANVKNAPTRPAEMPGFASRLASSLYSLAILREFVFSSQSTDTNSIALKQFEITPEILRKVIPYVSASASSLAKLAAVATSETNANEFGMHSIWLVTASCALAIHICSSLTMRTEDTAAFLACGIAESLIDLLFGRENLDEFGVAAPIVPIQSLNTNNAPGTRALRRGATMGTLSSAWGAAALTVGKSGQNMSLDGAPPDTSLRVGLGWLAAHCLMEPVWIVSASNEKLASEFSTQTNRLVSLTSPVSLGADSIFFAGSLLAYLVAHSRYPHDAMELPPSILTAITPLASFQKKKIVDTASTRNFPESVTEDDADENEEVDIDGNALLIIQGASTTILQAALATFSRYSNDAAVYSAFRGLVDVAGIASDDINAALDLLRGVFAILQPLIQTAPTRSSINAGGAAVAAASRPFDSFLAKSETDNIEIDNDSLSRLAIQKKVMEERLIKRASQLGVTKLDYFASLFELASQARTQLLLLEAVALSPFFAWSIVTLNGLAPLVRLFQYFAVAASIHSDILPSNNNLNNRSTTGNRILSSAQVIKRLEEVLSRIARTLAHLSRIGVDIRNTGFYSVDCEDLDPLKLPSNLDLHIIPETMTSRAVTGCVTTGVLTVCGSGMDLGVFLPAAAQLLQWVAASSSINPPDLVLANLPGRWGESYMSMLLSDDIVESVVALLRYTSTELRNLKSTAEKTSNITNTSRVTLLCEVLCSLMETLNHIASLKAGASAIVQRGASRVALRLIPTLISLSGNNRTSVPTAALTSTLRMLYTAVGGSSLNINRDKVNSDSEEVNSTSNSSINTALLNQGLMDALVQVVFSPLGITSATQGTFTTLASFSAFGETCFLAVSLASAVATPNDVETAASLLYEICKPVVVGVNEYVASSTAACETWNSALTYGEAAVSNINQPYLSLGEASGYDVTTDISANAENDENMVEDDDPSAISAGSTAIGSKQTRKSLIAALQLFGLLIITDAGRRSGLDAPLQGAAATASIMHSSISFMKCASQLCSTVSSTIASILGNSTGNVDASKSSNQIVASVPPGLLNAAATALAPLQRIERDLLWAAWLSCLVSRMSLNSFAAAAILAANDAGSYDLPVGIAVDWVLGGNEFAVESLRNTGEALISMVEAVSADNIVRLGATCDGSALLTLLPQGTNTSGTGVGGRSGGNTARAGAASAIAAAAAAAAASAVSIPSSDLLLTESAASLAQFAFSTISARYVANALEGRGIDILLVGLDIAATGGKDIQVVTSKQTSSEASAPRSPLVETECHILMTLAGIDKAGEDFLPLLSVAGITRSVMKVINDVITSANSSDSNRVNSMTTILEGNEKSRDARQVEGFAIQGTQAAFQLLASMVRVTPEEGQLMVSSGIVSFLRSASLLCGEEDSLKDASAIPPRPVLLKHIFHLIARLASVTRVLAIPNVVESMETEVETTIVQSLREFLVKGFSLVSSARAYVEDLSCIHALFVAVLDLAGDGEERHWLPQNIAHRTLVALRLQVPRAIPTCRRAIANTNASPNVVVDGKEVIRLLQGDDRNQVSDNGEHGGAASNPDFDELYEAIIACYAARSALLGLFSWIPKDDDPVSDVEGLEEAIDTLRTVTILLPAYYPVQALDGDATVTQVRRTSATPWQVFATARDYIGVSVSILTSFCLASTRLRGVLVDVVTACAPIITRMAVVASNKRTELIAAYWAGTSASWEPDPLEDVPILDATSAFCMALEIHLVPSLRSQHTLQVSDTQLTKQNNSLNSAVSKSDDSRNMHSQTKEKGASYIPEVGSIEQICRSIRDMTTGGGHEAVSAIAKSGLLSSTVRLYGILRSMSQSWAEENNNASALSADRSAATLSALTRSVITKGVEEIIFYCHKSDDQSASLRDVSAVIPVSALSILFRSAALLSVSQKSIDDNNENLSDENNVKVSTSNGDEALFESIITAVSEGQDGFSCLLSVFGDIGSGILSSATLASPSFDKILLSGGSNINTVISQLQLRLLDGILVALKRNENLKGKPINDLLLRGLFASIIVGASSLMGDSFVSALQASSLASIYYDPVALEHVKGKKENREHAFVSSVWCVPDAPLLEHHVATETLVEEI